MNKNRSVCVLYPQTNLVIQSENSKTKTCNVKNIYKFKTIILTKLSNNGKHLSRNVQIRNKVENIYFQD